MGLKQHTGSFRMRFILMITTVILMFTASVNIKAQEPPPRPIVVNVTSQELSFGAFYHGASGGTVTVDPSGSRSATGDVVLLSLGYSFSAALYEVIANPGTVISILNGPDVSLPGNNGGSLTLHIGDSNPASPFVTTVPYPTPTSLTVGGTITVSNSLANPPSDYSGTFDITLVQE